MFIWSNYYFPDNLLIISGHSHGNTEVFLQVLQRVFSDEGFKIGTSVATHGLQSADLLFKWCSRP